MSSRQVGDVTVVDAAGRITLGEGASVFRDVIRDLAAFCPTPRARLKTAVTAMRLHHGEQVYSEE